MTSSSFGSRPICNLPEQIQSVQLLLQRQVIQYSSHRQHHTSEFSLHKPSQLVISHMNQLLSHKQHNILRQEPIFHPSQSLLVKEKARHSQSVQTHCLSCGGEEIKLCVFIVFVSDKNQGSCAWYVAGISKTIVKSPVTLSTFNLFKILYLKA